MNKRPATAKPLCDGNSKTKGNKVDLKTSNIKPKAISKPSSANPTNRSMKQKGSHKPALKKKYTLETAAIVIQRNYRLYIKRLQSDPTYDLKQMLKKKKLGILQSYNIHIKEDHNKETAKFGVYSNAHYSNDYSSIEKDNKVINKKEVIDQEFYMNNKPNQNQKKEQKTLLNNSNIPHIQKKIYINEDLRGLQKRFCYEDETCDNDDEFYMKVKSDDIDNGVEHQGNEEEDYHIDNTNKVIEKDEKYNIVPIKNFEIPKIENVYEKIYNEMKKEKCKQEQPNLQEENNTNEDICKNNQHIQNVINIPLTNEIEEIIHPIAVSPQEIKPDESESQRPIIEIEQKSNIDHTSKHNDDIKKTKGKKDCNKINDTQSSPNETKTIPNQDISVERIELIEANNTINTLSLLINELKIQLKNKEDYISHSLTKQKAKEITLKEEGTFTETPFLEENHKNDCLISELKEKLSGMDKSTYKKLQLMRENYDEELKKNKDAWFQAEKIRRRKWEEDKINEIKDLTAKGLEPEIAKIIDNHKIEIESLEDHYIKEIKSQKQRLIDEYDCKISTIKLQLNNEKDELIEYEKNQAIQRLKNQNVRLEEEINEERRRWNSKLQNEITRLESLREKDKQTYEDQINKLEERNNKNVFSNEDIYNKKIEDIKRNYEEKISAEVDSLKKSIEKEHDKILESKKATLEAKYQEMRVDLIRDRDKQLNIVIEKLGEDTLEEKKKTNLECEKKANEKNIALIEENSLLRKQIGDLSEKLHAETKNRFNLEESIEQLTKKGKEKDFELDKKENKLCQLSDSYYQLSDKFAGLTREFNKEKMNLEIEMKNHLDKGEAEIQFLNNKLQTAHQLFEDQRNDIENNHRKEVMEIEAKLKKILKNRDDIIKKLQEDNQLKDVAINKYEEMLNKQRRDLLK